MRILVSTDSGPPCQSARYLWISKSAILLTPYILLQHNLVWWSRNPRAVGLYIGVQNYKTLINTQKTNQLKERLPIGILPEPWMLNCDPQGDSNIFSAISATGAAVTIKAL